MYSQALLSAIFLLTTPSLALPAPEPTSIALPGTGKGCLIGVRTARGPTLGSATFNLTRADGTFVWSDTAASPNFDAALTASTSTGANGEVPLRITTFPRRVNGCEKPSEDADCEPLVTYMQGSVVYRSGNGPEDWVVNGCYVGRDFVDENGGRYRDTLCEMRIDNC